jgi:hypothetical protein
VDSEQAPRTRVPARAAAAKAIRVMIDLLDSIGRKK